MKPVTVTQINDYIARRLNGDLNLRNIPVEGEISGLSRRGHVYFTLKDEESVMRAVIWKSELDRIDQSLLQDGRKVIAVGSIRVYVKGGYYSYQIHHLEDAGIGKAARNFEMLRQKLEKEGLFDPAHKRPLPPFPKRIGVITSTEGDALRDIRKIITKKNHYTDVMIFPAYVQGQQAPASLIRALETANRAHENGLPIDVLIIGRGGGSQEDLMAFNDEQLARAIYRSGIPVISAVGHETNFSISDFVADVRAETPTAAADLAAPDTGEIRSAILESRRVLREAISGKITVERRMLESDQTVLRLNLERRLRDVRNQLEQAALMLREGDPRKILGRGFAVVLDENDSLIPEISGISEGETYRIRLRDGSFRAQVTAIEKEETNE